MSAPVARPGRAWPVAVPVNLVLGYLGSWVFVGFGEVLLYAATRHDDPGFTWTGRQGVYDDGVGFALQLQGFLVVLVLGLFALVNAAVKAPWRLGGLRYWSLALLVLLLPAVVVACWPAVGPVSWFY